MLTPQENPAGALNAGAALVVAGKASDLKQGIEQAGHAIDSGAARRTLETLVRHSRAV
jgi:anthranilate phosphoribosyltransferase